MQVRCRPGKENTIDHIEPGIDLIRMSRRNGYRISPRQSDGFDIFATDHVEWMVVHHAVAARDQYARCISRERLFDGVCVVVHGAAFDFQRLLQKAMICSFYKKVKTRLVTNSQRTKSAQKTHPNGSLNRLTHHKQARSHSDNGRTKKLERRTHFAGLLHHKYHQAGVHQ